MPYAHPEALVSTEWLAAHLGDPHVRVLDSSYKQPGITPTAREDYERGHIPGAVFFDIDDVAQPGTTLPHMIPSAERFAQMMQERGIGNDDKVIVYDTVGLSSVGRTEWSDTSTLPVSRPAASTRAGRWTPTRAPCFDDAMAPRRALAALAGRQAPDLLLAVALEHFTIECVEHVGRELAADDEHERVARLVRRHQQIPPQAAPAHAGSFRARSAPTLAGSPSNR